MGRDKLKSGWRGWGEGSRAAPIPWEPLGGPGSVWGCPVSARRSAPSAPTGGCCPIPTASQAVGGSEGPLSSYKPPLEPPQSWRGGDAEQKMGCRWSEQVSPSCS